MENLVLGRQVPKIKSGQSHHKRENDDTGLINYLSELGLSDEHISNASSLLVAAPSVEDEEGIAPLVYGTGVSAQNTVSVFLAEEQEIFGLRSLKLSRRGTA